MNYVRRRSGVHRTAIGTPPKTAATRRNTVRPPSASCLEPLQSSLTTGRHSTLGHSGCPTLRKGAPSSSQPVIVGNKGTSTNSKLPISSSVRPASTQRFSTAISNKTIAVAPTRYRNVGRVAPVPSRPPSELTVLKEKISKMEKELENKDDQLKWMREMSEIQKENLERSKAKSENLEILREMLESKSKSLEEQLEESRKIHEKNAALIAEMVQTQNEKEIVFRKLHNEVVDLRGQIRVAIRVRPMLKSEECVNSASVIEYPAVNSILINQGSKSSGSFTFEKVFTHVFSQRDVFVNIEDFILSALHGYNVGLIAFGQTGSGKTHTMRGGEDNEEGVIPRAAAFLFRESENLETAGWKFEFSLSFLEVYNNEAYDLLNNHGVVKVRLSNQTVSLDGLSEHLITKQCEMTRLLRTADGNRKTAATKCNEYSSRSHAIYMWKIKAEQQSTGISTSSVLKLVDLAGSERVKESGVVGQQFKEMTNINQSLSVLQKCISMQKSKSTHIPYRDSKLTQVLMDCLGRGNSKTMVVVNINPCDKQATESKRSIEFAAKMRETHIGSAVQQRDL